MPLIEEYGVKSKQFEKSLMLKDNVIESKYKETANVKKDEKRSSDKSEKSSVWGPMFKDRQHFIDMHIG